MAQHFDIVVIGGGHAGIEAAWAAAQLGANTAMITFDAAAIGRMSCNPAIGGIGKGQMVREIDALGGLMGRIADESGIQFRMLNRRKGPAVWSPRCQSDRKRYCRSAQQYIHNGCNLTVLEGGVERIRTCELDRVDGANSGAALRVTGIELTDGRSLGCDAIIVTTGTFLAGLLHTGHEQTIGGRVGEPAATGLSASLRELGLRLGRLKTGTPPRVARDSVDYDRCEPQPGDADPLPFSFMNDAITNPQVECWITYTTPGVHALIRANLDRAPMFSGQIDSVGPRYCPSIEDKVVRFADRQRHQIFLEPEGYDSDRIYCNGISTSLPADVQAAMLKDIAGLENARIVQMGYAVEYDFVPPEQIDAALMTKRVTGLFLAGQINGTSGYEEAAGQGLIAGVNAVARLRDREPLILGRDEAYLGVMVDDLVTQDHVEPYRMFTSRAEHRLHLRYDNADSRLTPRGRAIGLVDDERWARFQSHEALLCETRKQLQSIRVDGRSGWQALKQPDMETVSIREAVTEHGRAPIANSIWHRLALEARYEGYLKRQQRSIAHFRDMEHRIIPENLNYLKIKHLRIEARERLHRVRPRSLGQAARVSGVHPTDVTVLMVALANNPGQECT